jgi:glucosamine 6-phosphate synthetase-like amidotransferase/phosphosugar isomerase protein
MNPVSPILFTIPCLQLLAYHCAIIKGTNVDMPRNLAKSILKSIRITVEYLIYCMENKR